MKDAEVCLRLNFIKKKKQINKGSDTIYKLDGLKIYRNTNESDKQVWYVHPQTISQLMTIQKQWMVLP